MNIENVGRTVAIIRGSPYNKKLVSIDDTKLPTADNQDRDVDNKLEFDDFIYLKLQDAKFEQYPNLEVGSNGKNKRDVLYVSGASGSGKSYYTKSFCSNYLKAFPKNSIYIFSQLVEDDSLASLGKALKRIVIDERVVTEPFTYTDFKNSLVIFDDVDALKNKIIKKALDQLKNEMLSLGRHEAITVVVTSHQTNKGFETKDIILESTSCTFFMRGGNNYTTILKSYLGFTDKQIKRLKKLNTRFVTVFKQAPMIIMTENQIFLRDSFDDEVIFPT